MLVTDVKGVTLQNCKNKTKNNLEKHSTHLAVAMVHSAVKTGLFKDHFKK